MRDTIESIRTYFDHSYRFVRKRRESLTKRKKTAKPHHGRSQLKSSKGAILRTSEVEPKKE